MSADDPGTLAAEVSGAISVTGLMLVFLPFFLDRLHRSRAQLPVKWIRRLRALMWFTAALVLLPAAAATTGLITLWGAQDLAVVTAVLSVATVWLVGVYTLLTVWLERKVWE